jgi:hypothetical protein
MAGEPYPVKPRPVTLKEHLDSIAQAAERIAAEAPESAGACFRTDPQSGETTCVFTDPITCKNIGGVFLGGPCGS